MPILIALFVGVVLYNEIGVDQKSTNQEINKEVVVAKQAEAQSNSVIVNSTPKPEPVKEEVKAEIKQPEPVKEEVKAEIKQPEPVKEEVKADEPENGYLKIILYIIASIATIFGGFYFFSSRGKNQTSNNTVDIARKDIEESYQPETQEPQPSQDDTQPETQEPQPSQDDTQPETQEPQPSQDDTQSETQEEQTTEDENNNK